MPGPAREEPAKAQLRGRMRQRLQQLSPAARAQASAAACERLEGQAVWRAASRILFYAPRPDEVDLAPLIVKALAAGKTVALPRFDPVRACYGAAQIVCSFEELPLGKFGLREPGAACPGLPLKQLDLVLIPGVAFDWAGRRLGRGGGFYDRLLADVRGTKCGVAFDEQVESQIPVEPHDVLLDCIVTPGRWHDVRLHRGGDHFRG